MVGRSGPDTGSNSDAAEAGEGGANARFDLSGLQANWDLQVEPLDPDQIAILNKVESGLAMPGKVFEETMEGGPDSADRLLSDGYDISLPTFAWMLHMATTHLLEIGGAECFERALQLQEKYRLPVSPQIAALVCKNVDEMKNYLMSDHQDLFRRVVRAFGLGSNEWSTKLSPMFLQVFQEMVRGESSSDRAMIEWVSLCGIKKEYVKSVLAAKLKDIMDVHSREGVKAVEKRFDRAKNLVLYCFDLPDGLFEEIVSKAVFDLVERGKIGEAKEWRKVLKIPKAEFNKWVQATVDTGLNRRGARVLEVACAVQAGNPVKVTGKRTVAARAGLLRHLATGEDELNLHTAVQMKKLFGVKLGREVKNAAKERMKKEIDRLRGDDIPVASHHNHYFSDLYTFAEEFGLEEEESCLRMLYIKLAMEQIGGGAFDLVNRIFDVIDYPQPERRQLAWGAMMSFIKADVHNVSLIKRIIEAFSLRIDDSDREVALMAVRDALDQQPGPYHDQPRVGFPEIELMEIMGLKFGGENEIRDRNIALCFVLNALRAGHMDKDWLARAAAVFDIDVECEDVVQAVIAGTIADLRRHGAKRVRELFELVKADSDVQQIIDVAVRRVVRQLRDSEQYPDARRWEREFPGAKVPVAKN